MFSCRNTVDRLEHFEQLTHACCLLQDVLRQYLVSTKLIGRREKSMCPFVKGNLANCVDLIYSGVLLNIWRIVLHFLLGLIQIRLSYHLTIAPHYFPKQGSLTWN